jgi:glucoamylase
LCTDGKHQQRHPVTTVIFGRAPDVAGKLQDAGDAMLAAVIYHSDHLELSEQFDGITGYEKSVRNLTWSYAAFLSAVPARTGQNVQG